MNFIFKKNDALTGALFKLDSFYPVIFLYKFK
jgi:hypothetical protein